MDGWIYFVTNKNEYMHYNSKKYLPTKSKIVVKNSLYPNMQV